MLQSLRVLGLICPEEQDLLTAQLLLCDQEIFFWIELPIANCGVSSPGHCHATTRCVSHFFNGSIFPHHEFMLLCFVLIEDITLWMFWQKCLIWCIVVSQAICQSPATVFGQILLLLMVWWCISPLSSQQSVRGVYLGSDNDRTRSCSRYSRQQK